MDARPHEPALRVQRYFETLSRERVAALGEVYSDEARFKDPFNEVQGVAAIRTIFEHMYRDLLDPRFEVSAVVGAGDQAFMTWNFRFRHPRLKGEQLIRGATHLHFAPDGRVRLHRDYWDAAEELYEKLPVVGTLVRLLRRRAAA
jgi:ketosteroid isomerase-like protein